MPLSDEARLAVTQVANTLALKRPKLDLIRRVEGLDYPLITLGLRDLLISANDRRALILPDLTAYGNGTVGIFSDYSGEGGGRYLTYSFLVCALDLTDMFSERMKSVRQEFSLGTKEISYKDLRMGQMRRSMPGYLKALDDLVPGFLLTVIVDRQIKSIFGPWRGGERKKLSDLLKKEDLGVLGPESAEKALRIVHIAAYLAALLAHNGQKIFWMTDKDQICANDKAHQALLKLFGRVLSLYQREGILYPLTGGARSFEERSIKFLDLLSAADIVAGTIQDYMTKRDLMPEDQINVKAGADDVLRWLAHDGVGLKKMSVVFRAGPGDMVTQGSVQISSTLPDQDVTSIPVCV